MRDSHAFVFTQKPAAFHYGRLPPPPPAVRTKQQTDPPRMTGLSNAAAPPFDTGINQLPEDTPGSMVRVLCAEWKLQTHRQEIKLMVISYDLLSTATLAPSINPA